MGEKLGAPLKYPQYDSAGMVRGVSEALSIGLKMKGDASLSDSYTS